MMSRTFLKRENIKAGHPSVACLIGSNTSTYSHLILDGSKVRRVNGLAREQVKGKSE